MTARSAPSRRLKPLLDTLEKMQTQECLYCGAMHPKTPCLYHESRHSSNFRANCAHTSRTCTRLILSEAAPPTPLTEQCRCARRSGANQRPHSWPISGELCPSRKLMQHSCQICTQRWAMADDVKTSSTAASVSMRCWLTSIERP